MKRIESFKTFSQLQTQLREETKQKEIATKREAAVAEYDTLLSKYGVSKINELSKEDRAKFISELNGDIEEGNAFSAARAKAIADGEKEFTVDGETYPVEDVDKEDKENAEEFAVKESEEDTTNEARIQIDVIDPANKYLMNTVKKLGLGMNIITWDGPGGGHPEVEFTGKRKDIDALLDKHFGSKEDFEDFIEESVITEARHSEIHKAAKKGSYPVTIVITNKHGKFDGEVAHQETVDTPAAVPAAMKVLYKKYATWAHTFAIEDSTGKVLFQEGLEYNESGLEIDTVNFTEETLDTVELENIEERNAFIFAAAKAKKEGKKRFKFKGKTFPVTLKVDLLK